MNWFKALRFRSYRTYDVEKDSVTVIFRLGGQFKVHLVRCFRGDKVNQELAIKVLTARAKFFMCSKMVGNSGTPWTQEQTKSGSYRVGIWSKENTELITGKPWAIVKTEDLAA